MKKQINIGLFGLGVVGQGVVEILEQHAIQIERDIGIPIRITHIAVSNLQKKRAVDTTPYIMTTDASLLLENSDIDIIVELMGGLTTAETVITSALQKGKYVVTANKALLAEKSQSILEADRRSRRGLGFEASVSSAIPIVRSIRQSFVGDSIATITGIFNSTSNYILSRMEEESMDYGMAVELAQQKGYAEVDPSLDVNGIDAAHKLNIMVNFAFKGLCEFSSIHVEGIADIESGDIKNARKLGYTVKLVGYAERHEDFIEAWVQPLLLSGEHILSPVRDVYNAIRVVGAFSGPAIFHGIGAGSHAAASAAVGDILEAAQHLLHDNTPFRRPESSPVGRMALRVIPFEELEFENYLRLTLRDESGILAAVTGILAEEGISLKSIHQNTPEILKTVSCAEVIMVTHRVREKRFRAALHKLNELPSVISPIKTIHLAPEDI